MAVLSIETGMAVREISVVRALSRNRNSTIATTTIASSSTFSTFLIEVSMKLACRKTTVSTLMPFGMPWLSSAIALCTSTESAIVSTAGCFSTETMTADLPMKPASPRFSLAP